MYRFNSQSFLIIVCCGLFVGDRCLAQPIFVTNDVFILDSDFGVGTTNPLTPLLFVDSATGDVGIGTTSPGIVPGANKYLSLIGGRGTLTSLEIQGGANGPAGTQTTIDFISRTTGNTDEITARIAIINGDGGGGTAKGHMLFYTTGDTFTISERMRIMDDGDVGIGTSSPSQKLHVIGNVQADDYLFNSSREYKDQIEALSAHQSMSVLKDLKPVTFKFKTDKDKNHVGFIAEEVPELVASKDRKSLSPMNIVAVLTKVVQQQQKEIEELKARLNERQ